jgi:hypothetical protein
MREHVWETILIIASLFLYGQFIRGVQRVQSDITRAFSIPGVPRR